MSCLLGAVGAAGQLVDVIGSFVVAVVVVWAALLVVVVMEVDVVVGSAVVAGVVVVGVVMVVVVVIVLISCCMPASPQNLPAPAQQHTYACWGFPVVVVVLWMIKQLIKTILLSL